MSPLLNFTDYSNATADIVLKCSSQHAGNIFWICISVVCFVLGFPGVVTVLLDMFQKVRKGTLLCPMDFFMLNLTFMDGICLLFLLPQLYNGVHWNNLVYRALASFIYTFNLCGRPLFLSCICLDFYLAVVHPVTYRGRKSPTPRILVAVGVWTVTVAYGCYFAIGHKELYIFLTPILFFVLLSPVIGFCDIIILRTLNRSRPGGTDVHPQKKRALQIIFNNIVVTSVSYLPPIISVCVSQILRMDIKTFRCRVVTPVICISLVGNTVSLIVYLSNLGKLEWLKCWKQK